MSGRCWFSVGPALQTFTPRCANLNEHFSEGDCCFSICSSDIIPQLQMLDKIERVHLDTDVMAAVESNHRVVQIRDLVKWASVERGGVVHSAPDCHCSHACVPGSSPADPTWVFQKKILVSPPPPSMWLGDHVNGGLVELIECIDVETIT